MPFRTSLLHQVRRDKCLRSMRCVFFSGYNITFINMRLKGWLNIMKKFLNFFLAIVLALSLPGCGGQADRFPEDEETAARADALLQEAQDKRDAILSAETAIVKGDTQIPGETYTGTAYYIANSGDDSAAGTSPEAAWASIERLNRAELRPGDAVFFNRGDLWRAVQIESRKGVTYSAYGQGEKPRLYGSVESGAGADCWTLWHEGKHGEKIWVYARDMLDCGAIVMNSGEAVAEKVQAFWNGQTYQIYSTLWHTGQDSLAAADQAAQPVFDPANDLTEDMTFFAQSSNIAFRGNYVLYSGMSSWTDTKNVNASFLIDGGPNMQDGTVEVTDNVFFAADDCLVFIKTYVPEYLPDFERNHYVQLGSKRLIFIETIPNYWGAYEEEGIRERLADQSGEILILPSPRWKSVDW